MGEAVASLGKVEEAGKEGASSNHTFLSLLLSSNNLKNRSLRTVVF